MQAYDICPFEIRSASDADYACLNEFKNVLRLEVMPEDPPVSITEDANRWRSVPDYILTANWAAREAGGRIIAFADTEIEQTGDNEHMLEFEIQVLPEFRRQGIARQMLRLIVDHARRNNRRLMITDANERVPAGIEFLSGVGGRRGMEAHLNQLRLAELDRRLIQCWLEASAPLSREFRLAWRQGPCPDEGLQQLADLFQVVANDQPRDTLEMEDHNYSPDVIRQFERMIFAGGRRVQVLCITEGEHDRLVGYTEVFWHPDRPKILTQSFTGVAPEYRGRGLGRWMKAEMLNRLLRDHPEAEVIRTGNADSNASMLKINTELGYKPYISWCVWQVDTDAAERYLAARNSVRT